MNFSEPLNIWHAAMVGVNILCSVIYFFLYRKSVQQDRSEPENVRYKKILRNAGAVFVAVSLYRSIFVCSYPNRISWFDTMFNSPLVIRVFATFAEISFALLVMGPVVHLNKEMPLRTCKFANSSIGNFMVYKMPYGTFICLFAAQFCAYSGLVTQHLTIFAIEETLWTIGFFCSFPAALCHLVDVFKHHKNDRSMRLIKLQLVLLCVYTFGYLIYQIGFSLPFTYYSQLAADLAKPHYYGMQAVKDAVFKFSMCRDFNEWGGIGFFIWHSGYFSICTCMNMVFAMAPRKLKD